MGKDHLWSIFRRLKNWNFWKLQWVIPEFSNRTVLFDRTVSCDKTPVLEMERIVYGFLLSEDLSENRCKLLLLRKL